ncbi:transcription termination factor MTERF9, chloroplastic-like [Lycium ferocissimum]|uniref:transcription termination factor MTERF9, chloroplastic-like n=1 Tax=Lycium ferocissimum TaxID=112874 RepID=UPI0028166CC7|nr:transcription termination factor MTERF9, chloroplastic-like [Lycium ferocissimum]
MLVKARALSSALIFKFNGNGFLFQYSTTAPTNHFMVKYLINSLGFSKEEAISSSAKVSYHINTDKNPDLFINFLKQTGFSNTQIKILVSKSPDLLFYDVERILKPKLHCLTELGLSGSDIVKILLRDWTFFSRGLDTHIRPVIKCLRILLGSDENVVKVIKKTSWLISYNGGITIQDCLNLLQSVGCSNDKIKNFVLTRPGILKLGAKKLEETLHRVEKEFGVSPDSAMFLHIVSVLASHSRSNLDKKVEIFKSFGWSDSDVLTMLQKLPYCVGLSDAKVRTALTFLMNELGHESVYIASRPSLLMCSLEKRVRPRYEIWKLVNEKKLTKCKWGFYTVVSCPESRFLEKYVLPLKAELPDLYDLYIKNIGK